MISAPDENPKRIEPPEGRLRPRQSLVDRPHREPSEKHPRALDRPGAEEGDEVWLDLVEAAILCVSPDAHEKEAAKTSRPHHNERGCNDLPWVRGAPADALRRGDGVNDREQRDRDVRKGTNEVVIHFGLEREGVEAAAHPLYAMRYRSCEKPIDAVHCPTEQERNRCEHDGCNHPYHAPFDILVACVHAKVPPLGCGSSVEHCARLVAGACRLVAEVAAAG